MGYFSNGTEGDLYQEEYCEQCVHDINQDCPVWMAHLLLNYEECNKPGSILHLLIPRQEDGFNGKCKMFIPKEED